jgi:hypothetical protein
MKGREFFQDNPFEYFADYGIKNLANREQIKYHWNIY